MEKGRGSSEDTLPVRGMKLEVDPRFRGGGLLGRHCQTPQLPTPRENRFSILGGDGQERHVRKRRKREGMGKKRKRVLVGIRLCKRKKEGITEGGFREGKKNQPGLATGAGGQGTSSFGGSS